MRMMIRHPRSRNKGLFARYKCRWIGELTRKVQQATQGTTSYPERLLILSDDMPTSNEI